MKKYLVYVFALFMTFDAYAVTIIGTTCTDNISRNYVMHYTSCNAGYYMETLEWTGTGALARPTPLWNGDTTVYTTTTYDTCTKCPQGKYKTTTGAGGIEECIQCPDFIAPDGSRWPTTTNTSWILGGSGDNTPDSVSDCYVPSSDAEWPFDNETGSGQEKFISKCFSDQ